MRMVKLRQLNISGEIEAAGMQDFDNRIAQAIKTMKPRISIFSWAQILVEYSTRFPEHSYTDTVPPAFISIELDQIVTRHMKSCICHRSLAILSLGSLTSNGFFLRFGIIDHTFADRD